MKEGGQQYIPSSGISTAYSCVHWLRTNRNVMDDLPIESPLSQCHPRICTVGEAKAYRNRRPHTLLSIFGYRHPLGRYGPALGPGNWSVALYAASWLTFDSSEIVRGQQNCSWSQLAN